MNTDDEVKRAQKGGKARAAALTPEQRRLFARKAALTRWAKAKVPGYGVSISFSQPGPPTKICVVKTEVYNTTPILCTDTPTFSSNVVSSFTVSL